MKEKKYSRADLIGQTALVLNLLSSDAPRVYTVSEICEKTGIRLTAVKLILISLALEGWVVMTEIGYIVLGRTVEKQTCGSLRVIADYLSDFYQHEPSIPRIWNLESDNWKSTDEC